MHTGNNHELQNAIKVPSAIKDAVSGPITVVDKLRPQKRI